jgi:tryptophanyl-tRNA synthetase
LSAIFDRPEAANLLGLYGLATGATPSQVAAEMEGKSWGEFKPMLADALVESLGAQNGCAFFAMDAI